MKKSRFNLYDMMNRSPLDRKDAEDDLQAPKMGFKWFFKLFSRRFSNIVQTNLLFVIGNFPLAFLMVIFSGAIYDHSIVPQTLSFSNLYGAIARGNVNPLTAVVGGIAGAPITENEFKLPLLILFLCLSALILFTFGLVNCGCAHIMRSIVRREPVFLFKDFFGTIKKNLKQGLLLGIFDILFLALIGYDLYFFYLNYNFNFFSTIAFFLSLAVLLFYLFARMYMYMITITFDLPIRKILKNSFIFSMLGFKRNILALLGQIVLLAVTFSLLMSGYLTALGAILPLVFLFGTGLFMSYYASYKVIRQYMIDPYYDSEGNPLPATANNN